MSPDMVNHPPHYNKHPSGVECITVVEHFNFNIGNAIKYLWRAGEKGSAIEDLEKAAWYIQRELKRRGRREVRSDSTRVDVVIDSRRGLPSDTSTPAAGQ
jgi:hypothetical protein